VDEELEAIKWHLSEAYWDHLLGDSEVADARLLYLTKRYYNYAKTQEGEWTKEASNPVEGFSPPVKYRGKRKA
jgi:hypothetical protein